MYHVVKTNVYIKNSSDNLINTFTIHEMCDCQCMILKEINIIFVSVIICSIVDNSSHPLEGKEKSITVLIQKCFFWKETSTYWKFKDNIFKLFRARTWHNCCATVLCKFLQLVISLLNEWSIDNSAAFICKTSVFG